MCLRLLRSIVACGWFGIQTWIGGQAINAMLRVLIPSATANPLTPWLCFFVFWGLNLFVIWRGIETIRVLHGIGAPFMLAVGLLLLFYITRKAGGLGPVLSARSQFKIQGSSFVFRSIAHCDGGILGHGGVEYH